MLKLKKKYLPEDILRAAIILGTGKTPYIWLNTNQTNHHRLKVVSLYNLYKAHVPKHC